MRGVGGVLSVGTRRRPPEKRRHRSRLGGRIPGSNPGRPADHLLVDSFYEVDVAKDDRVLLLVYLVDDPILADSLFPESGEVAN